MDKEEGEMSDDNSMVIDNVREQSPIRMETADMAIVYKPEVVGKGVVVEKLEMADAKKLEERAKRFGLNLYGARAITQKHINDLYSNFIEENNERHFRLDTLHLKGVEGLTTKDIFEYLEDYKPLSLEWVDKMSCNVVYHDNISAALAILAHSREIKDEHLKEIFKHDHSKHWREGFPHPKKDFILFRFATNSDKKDFKISSEKNVLRTRYGREKETAVINSKNPWGDLCSSWGGVYDHQEVLNRRIPFDYDDEEEEENDDYIEPVRIKSKRMAKRLGKRKTDIQESDESCSDSEWKLKSKVPRMRMHADDEEPQEKRNLNVKREPTDPFDSTLSIEIANERTVYAPRPVTKLSDKFKFRKELRQVGSIRSRLGSKVKEDSSDGSESEVSIGVRSSLVDVGSVWSRLDSTISNSSRGDLRDRLKSRKTVDNDLRYKIHARDRIRVEIDNDDYSD